MANVNVKESFLDYIMRQAKSVPSRIEDIWEYAAYGSSPSEREGAQRDLNKMIENSDKTIKEAQLLNRGKYELDIFAGRPEIGEMYLEDGNITRKTFDELYGEYTSKEPVSREEAGNLLSRARNLEESFIERYFSGKKDKKSEIANDALRDLDERSELLQKWYDIIEENPE